MTLPAERSSSRTITSQLLLRTIYDRGPISRADLVRASGLTAPTVSEIAAGLLTEGFIEETGLGPSTGGKRPTLLRVVDDSRHLIGLDLARGDFRGAVLNLRGEIRQSRSLPLGGLFSMDALELVYSLVDQLLAATDRPVIGIGIGAPGLVDAARGFVVDAVNVGWHNLPLADLLQQRTGLPVYVANDCHTAVLAEHLFGTGGQPGETLVVINTGYGVGAGIIIDGKLLPGSPFGAGEIGHLVVDPGGEICRCGSRGCLETVASTRGIARRALQRGLLSGSLGEVYSPGDEGQPEMRLIHRLCTETDAAVEQLIRETGSALGKAAASLVGVLGCCRILFAGSVTCFGGTLLSAAREELDARTFSTVARESEIGFVSVGADIVLRGTSVLVLSREMRLL